MPLKSVSPTELEGEALRRWYLRSPDEIEQEREAAEAQRYRDFFEQPKSTAAEPVRQPHRPPVDEDVLWVANGYGGYRAVRPGQQDYLAATDLDAAAGYPAYLPANSAAVEDSDFLKIGSRENALLKKIYIEKYGSWPKTKDGRDYEVSHKRAIADGGKNALDNIEPIHPDDHRPMHVRQGDSARYGKRSSIAKAFGGRVEPWHGGPAVRGLGVLGTLANLPGLLLNPPRTNSLENFTTDVLGLPSMDDYRRAWERPRGMYSDCPPGQMCA